MPSNAVAQPRSAAIWSAAINAAMNATHTTRVRTGIDASTGCMYWMYKAAAAVRSAVSVGPGRTPGEHLAYFGDLAGNAYALNAATGEQVNRGNLVVHPFAGFLGQGRLAL